MTTGTAWWTVWTAERESGEDVWVVRAQDGGRAAVHFDSSRTTTVLHRSDESRCVDFYDGYSGLYRKSQEKAQRFLADVRNRSEMGWEPDLSETSRLEHRVSLLTDRVEKLEQDLQDVVDRLKCATLNL